MTDLVRRHPLTPAAQVAAPYSRAMWRLVPPLTIVAGLLALTAFGLMTWLYLGGIATVVLTGAATYLGALGFANYQARSQNVRHAWRRAQNSLRAGELEEARALLWNAERELWIPPYGDARLLLLRAELELREGNIEEAAALFDKAVGSGWLAPDGPLVDMLPETFTGLARFAVIEGRTRDALSWRQQLATLELDARAREALMLYIDALVDARCGDHDPLLRRLRAAPELEPLDREQRRTLEMLEDFALAHVEPTGFRRDASAGVWTRWSPGEFLYMTPRWPDLEDFLRSRGPLVALPASADETG
ncbi:MAG: hypothetical protein KC468_02720 [Myxococcales bacterium]|nr:hypothetical protein [Myxococcales bacterium]